MVGMTGMVQGKIGGIHEVVLGIKVDGFQVGLNIFGRRCNVGIAKFYGEVTFAEFYIGDMDGLFGWRQGWQRVGIYALEGVVEESGQIGGNAFVGAGISAVGGKSDFQGSSRFDVKILVGGGTGDGGWGKYEDTVVGIS